MVYDSYIHGSEGLACGGEFSFLFAGSEGRNWGQWVDIKSLQLNTWKIFLTIRISSSENHFLGMRWCVTEVDCYLVAILKQEI